MPLLQTRSGWLLLGRDEITLNQPGRINGRRNPFPYDDWHSAASTPPGPKPAAIAPPTA